MMRKRGRAINLKINSAKMIDNKNRLSAFFFMIQLCMI